MNITIPPGYKEVSAKTLAGYPEAFESYTFNLYITMTCAAITFIPIALAISNLTILFGVFTEALYRISLYTTVAETHLQPIMTSRDCLMLTVFLRVIGDIWTPLIELLMGIERFTAVYMPAFFRTVMSEHSKKLLASTAVISFITIMVPTTMTLVSPDQDVAYSCGRKAAFSEAFGFLDYGLNIFGYLIAFILNVLAFVRASSVQQSAKNLAKMRSYTMISLFSTILIAIPNVSSTLEALGVPIPTEVRRPTVVMAGLNSAVLFFIYLTFNVPYRMRFLQFVTFALPKKMRVTYVTSSAGKTVVGGGGGSARKFEHSTRIATVS
uniref:G_PROTEIN_RECEP_F1_2 domain-containing protein n=1 Tax=Panagrellus redivivus TaxID=6233 RepID=A0A7E4VZQ7_PANRE